MRKILIVIFVLGISILSAKGEDPNLLFEIKFDSYAAIADFAKGQKASQNFKSDLQLRMFPGINGKGNALKLNGKEFCAYPMSKNFNTQQGTLNLWVSPQNWKFNEERNQIFFDAKQADFRLLLYKFNNLPFPGVYFQYGKQNQGVHAKINPVEWENRQWHMLTVVWSKDLLKLYVDGKMPDNYAPGNVHPAIPAKKFAEPLVIPPVSPDGIIGLGNLHQSFKTDQGDETAFDELAVYDRCLSDMEILSLYEKYFPRQAKEKPPVMTVPKIESGITLDGKIDAAEWSNSIRIPFMQAYKIANHLMPSDTWMQTKHDGKFLYLGFSTNLVNTHCKCTNNDENIYNDDVFEFYINNKNKDALWFCINGNGAILDAKNGDRKYNSGAKGAGFVNGSNGWSAEIAIPLSELGNPSPTEALNSNFWTLNFAKAPNYYWCWYGDPENHAGAGKIFLSGRADEVSIEKVGKIFNGDLDLIVKSPGRVALSLTTSNKDDAVNMENIANKNFKKKLAPGRYQLTISGEKDCFLYDYEFVVNSPLTLNYKSYPAQKVVVVKVDLNGAGSGTIAMAKAGGLKGVLQLNKGSKILSEAAFAPSPNTEVKLALPAELEKGDYEITACITGKDISLKNAAGFRVPDPAPYLAKTACDHTVPDPWIKIEKVNDNVFKVLDREYHFNGSPFPAEMISRGDKVAAQPVLKINSMEVTWSDFKVAELYDDYAVFTGNGKSPGLDFKWRGELWFDGLYKLDYSMTPETNKIINSMILSWQVPSEFSRYFLQHNNEYVHIPWRENSIRTNVNIADASWLTGIEKGMLFMPLTNANFVSGSFELKRGPENTDITVNIISKEVTLKKTADYSICFMATPARRPPENFRTMNEGGYLENRYENLQISSTDSPVKNPRADEVLGYASHIMRFPDRFRNECLKPYGGIRLIPYHQPTGISQLDPEFDYYLAEWRETPGYIQSNIKRQGHTFDLVHCCGEGIADLMAYRLEKLYKDFPDLGGIYYDICNVNKCNNTAHGHGGVDAFGESYYTSTAMSLRNYLMRIYKVSHQQGKIVLNHAHNYFNPIAHNFSDAWYPGENEVWLYSEKPDYYYCEAPVGEYQSAWSSVIRGTAIIRCNQVTRVSGFTPALKSRAKEFSSEKFAYRSFASAFLYDFNVDSDWINHRAVERFWKVRSKLNLNRAEFFGYWYQNTIKSSSSGVYCSYYKLNNAPYKYFIIAANMGREDKKANIDIDFSRLGLDPAKVALTDLWSEQDITKDDLKQRIIPGNLFFIIGIR